MHILLLALFPVLLLFNTPLAFVCLAVAIVLIYRGRTSAAPRQRTEGRIEDHSV
jgi:hypothetical protein